MAGETQARSVIKARNQWWLSAPFLTLATATVTVLFTTFGVAIGHFIAGANQSRELDLKLVEIGLSILRGEATENSQPAREYAIAILRKYPGQLDVPPDLWIRWLRSGDVPFRTIAVGSFSDAGTLRAGRFLNAPIDLSKETIEYGVSRGLPADDVSSQVARCDNDSACLMDLLDSYIFAAPVGSSE